jgi:hypothetical protein
MKTRCLILALVVGLGLGSAGMLQAVGDKKANATEVAKLIAQLGSKKFKEREKAVKALEAMGAPALPALRKAAASDDKEISKLAKDLIDKIEKQVEAAALLEPTKVHLVCKDTAVPDAVADLAKQSKYDIKLTDGAKEKLAKRKITLDTGKVTFWEAFDRLCKKANLVEAGVQMPGVRPVPPIRLQPLPVPVKPAAPPAKQLAPAAVQNVQVQVQVVPAAAQPGALPPAPPPVPGGGVRIQPFPIGNANQIILDDGKPEDVPTCYSGAFRIRLKLNALNMAVPQPGQNAKPAAKKTLFAQLEVRAEPKVKGWYLSGKPTLETATDDQGQKLTVFQPEVPRGGPVRFGNPVPAIAPAGGRMAPMPLWRGNNQQTTYLQLNLGEKEAKKIKVFKGKLAVQTQTAPAALITVDNILKAAGKTVKGAKGGSIKVLEAAKDEDGNYKVRFELERPAGVSGGVSYGGFGGGVVPAPRPAPPPAKGGNFQVQIQIGGGGRAGIGWASPGMGGLSLVDAKGKPFLLVGATAQAGQGVKEQTLIFKPNKGQGEPAKFIFTGQRSVTVDIPFSFKDVKLP